MENRELVTSKQITKDIIGNFLFWELILQFCYTIIFRLIIKNINSAFPIICISIFLQLIIAIFVWKITLAKSFKKKVILYKDVPYIMQNSLVLVIIICLIMAIYNISSISSTIDEVVEESVELQFLDSFVNKINNQNIASTYSEQKEAAIKSVKSEVYKYTIVFDIFFALINLLILPFERKQLLNYVAIEEDLLANK